MCSHIQHVELFHGRKHGGGLFTTCYPFAIVCLRIGQQRVARLAHVGFAANVICESTWIMLHDLHLQEPNAYFYNRKSQIANRKSQIANRKFKSQK